MHETNKYSRETNTIHIHSLLLPVAHSRLPTNLVPSLKLSMLPLAVFALFLGLTSTNPILLRSQVLLSTHKHLRHLLEL
jgi:hypothetical protein